ncbi:MAG: hypothetical protein AAGG50_21740 [Bacteroidota bacterium]
MFDRFILLEQNEPSVDAPDVSASFGEAPAYFNDLVLGQRADMVVADISEYVGGEQLDLVDYVVQQIADLFDQLASSAVLLNLYLASLPSAQDDVSREAAQQSAEADLDSGISDFDPSQVRFQARGGITVCGLLC